MHIQRRLEVDSLFWPHLVVEAEETDDLLGKLCRMSDLTLVKVLAFERVVEAFDYAVGFWRAVAGAHVLEPSADTMPTRRLTTAEHA